MLNRHEIMGRLVRDPELTQGKDETKDRINFTVAVDDDFGDGTEFIDCVLFGKRAKVIEKYFRKGSGIYVAGKGSVNSYTGKDGVKRKSYSIMVSAFQFPPGSKQQNSSTSASEPEQATNEEWKKQEEDIPF